MKRLQQEKGIGRQRIFLILGVLSFIGLYHWAYIHWLSPLFDYYGFEYYEPHLKFLVLAWVCAAAPSVWMPLKIKRPTHLAYWVLYMTVYIPSIFVPLFIGLNEPVEIAKLMVTLFAGFAICGISHFLPLISFKRLRISKTVFWCGFAVFGLVCAACLAIAYRHNMRLLSFTEVYDLRGESADIEAGTFLNYPLMWLYGAISPFLIASGLYYRKSWLFLAGAAGEVLVYACIGTKASVLSIVFITVIYVLFRVGKWSFPSKFVWGIAGLCAILCSTILGSFAEKGVFATSLTVFMFLVFFRTFGLAGLATGQYFYFFHHNPYTYYSHIKGISLLVHYPFKYVLGTELGYYYYNPLVDLTAHFWATDGIAAWGLPGILLVSVIFAFICWMIDSLARWHDPRFAGLVIFYATYNLANLSLFTTMFSGGLCLLILILYVFPPQVAEHGTVNRANAKTSDLPAGLSRSFLPAR